MELYTSKRERIIVEDNPFSSGGEGEVRMIKTAPSQYQGKCVKIYYQQKRTLELENKIKYMVSHPPQQVSGTGFLIGWPLEYVTDKSSNFMGFVMPLAFSNSKQLITLTAPKLSNKLEKEWVERYDRSLGVYALMSRLKLICNISVPIHILHSTGRYVLKDFKPENVLITYNGRVTLVDMDSLQISENGKMLFPGTAATPNYIPTEYYKNGVGKNPKEPLDKSWDLFALSVVFYQVLFGLHPYVVTPLVAKDANSNEIFQNIADDLFPFGVNAGKIKSFPPLHNKFNVLHPTLKEYFKRAFSINSSQRPTAMEWGKCLHDIIKSSPNIPKPALPNSIPQGPKNGPTTPKSPSPSPSSPQGPSGSQSPTTPPPTPPKGHSDSNGCLGGL